MLGLLSIATHNLATLQQFYRDLLDCDPDVDLADTYVEFRLSGFRLGLYRSSNPDFAPSLGATSLTLQVTDLDAVLAKPVMQNTNLSEMRVEFHGREVDFCDPDGNRIVLHEPSSTFWQLMGLEASGSSR